MTQWYTKELAKLTDISVQTLHHYDRIGLLTPSLRRANGYRLYSEADLLKLQQIIALKFFGFKLGAIKTLLSGNVDTFEHFAAQAQFLEEKAKSFREASTTLKSIIAECPLDKSIPWKSIIQSIGVYQMTQQLEKTWAGKVLTPEELKQYADFSAGLKTRFTEADKEAVEAAWADITTEIQANLTQDPAGPYGGGMATRAMALVNRIYGQEYAGLRHSIWHKGFKTGQMDGPYGFTPEVVTWLDRAMDAYYRGRIYDLLDQAALTPNTETLAQWQALMEEMCGDSDDLRQNIITQAMIDSRVSPAARTWLQQFQKNC